MTLEPQQLKQIIQYSGKRMYFGNWRPAMLDDFFYETSGGTESKNFYINNLTNGFICDVLWYEMSYNPVRFGTVSPFKNNGKNDIIYFNDTYRQNLSRQIGGWLPKKIMDLIWQISDFVKNLKQVKLGDDKTTLYTKFIETGKLPLYLPVLGKNAEYYVLTALRRAVHAIADQNWQDLQDPLYKEQIVKIAQQRHPTGNRSDISYMAVKAEKEIKSAIESIKTNPTKTEQKQQPQQKVQKQPKQIVIQECFPFAKNEKIDKLAIIREKIRQKKYDIAMIEQQIEDLQEFESIDLTELHKKLKTAKLQYAALCAQEQRQINKLNISDKNQNSGR